MNIEKMRVRSFFLHSHSLLLRHRSDEHVGSQVYLIHSSVLSSHIRLRHLLTATTVGIIHLIHHLLHPHILLLVLLLELVL